MFNQTTPQDYLNDMHAIDIPKLYHPRLNPRDRASGIQKAKKELGRLTMELQHHRDSLRSQNKSLSDAEMKQTLAPYNLLQNLLQQLTNEVKNLEDILGAGKMLPQGFEFGNYIFGDEEEWFIGDEAQYNDWQKADNVKQRLNGFKREGQPLRDKLAEVHAEYKAHKDSYQVAQKKLDKQHKKGYILRRIFVLLILTILAGVGGAYVYLEMGEQLGLIGFGLAGLFFLLIPLGYFDWKKRNRKLVAFVREEKTQMRRLQAEGKEIQQRYRPIEYEMTMLASEYKRLRAGLNAGEETSVA